MTRNRALLAGLVFALATVGVSVWAFPLMPPVVPSRWDASGHVVQHLPKAAAAIMVPLIVAFTWLLMAILPSISPRGFRIDRFAGSFYISVLAIIAVLFVTHTVVVLAQLGLGPAPTTAVVLPIGALLVIFGNVMPKLRKNFFIGIRTPWTLASDEVWSRTNRLSGHITVAGGLAIMAASFFPTFAPAVLIAVVAIIVIVPAAYSFIVYKQLEGFGPNGEPG